MIGTILIVVGGSMLTFAYGFWLFYTMKHLADENQKSHKKIEVMFEKIEKDLVSVKFWRDKK